MKISNYDEFKKKNIAILWYWLEGKSTLLFLKKIWVEKITVLDKNDIKSKEKWVNYINWENYLDNLEVFDLIIKSPWISPYTNNLYSRNLNITTQTELFLNNYNWKVIWITWTKWKSTISTILYLSLQKAWYNVKLVWNIWNPVLDEIDILKWNNYDYIVYEMSSYMLEWIEPKLHIWYINNIYSCHLEWHNWIKNYSHAKINILKNSKHKVANIETKDEIKNIDNIEYFWEGTNYLYKEKWFYINNKIALNDENFLLIWEHNKLNILWIITIFQQIKKDKFCSLWVFNRLINWLNETLKTFKWLPHRLEEIWIHKDIIFIDDAIATTPESTIAAIKTYEHKIWTLFLWWYDYWFNFSNLVENIIKYKIKNIVLFPESWEKIFWDLSNYDYDKEFKLNIDWIDLNILKTRSMENAVIFWYKYTNPWMICLLSNASASYWLWSWYVEKWKQFQEFIKKHSLK